MSVVVAVVIVLAGLLLIGAVVFGLLRNRKAPETSATGKSHGSSATR